MPKMDGLEMLASLRAESESPNKDTPCVALTANAMGDAREMYLEAGFADYLSKPIDSAKLEAMISQMLPKEKVLHKGDEGFIEKTDGTKQGAKGGWDGIERRKNAKSAGDNFFSKLFGIDISLALKNCGGEEVFTEALKNFWEAIQEKSNLIEEYEKNSDWKNYTVLVHALKSSARLIGATKLSEDAAYLEQCGDKVQKDDEGAKSEIEGKSPKLLSDYREYFSKLAPLCGEAVVCSSLCERTSSNSATASTKPLINEERFNDALSALREVISVFDFDSADAIIKEVDSYAIPEGFAEKYAKIKKAVRDVDTAKVLELIG